MAKTKNNDALAAPIGTVIQYGGVAVPVGWSRCGRLLSAELYPDIFSLLSDSGACEIRVIGKNTYFRLPDFGVIEWITGEKVYSIIKVK